VCHRLHHSGFIFQTVSWVSLRSHNFNPNFQTGRCLSQGTMTTSSASPAGSGVHMFTVEQAISVLMAQLRLGDIEETDNHGTEKRHVEALISDAEYALRIQAEDLVNAVQVIEDAQFARELEAGFQADHRYLIVNTPSTAHHREIAHSVLSRSGLVPQPKESSSSTINLGSGLGTGAVDADLAASQYDERCVETDLNPH
jgi:hypothetical protein